MKTGVVLTGRDDRRNQFWIVIGIRLEDNLVIRKPGQKCLDDVWPMRAGGSIGFPRWFARQGSGGIGDYFIGGMGRGHGSGSTINGRITGWNDRLCFGQ